MSKYSGRIDRNSLRANSHEAGCCIAPLGHSLPGSDGKRITRANNVCLFGLPLQGVSVVSSRSGSFGGLWILILMVLTTVAVGAFPVLREGGGGEGEGVPLDSV